MILLAQICRDCENIIPIIKTNYTKKCPTPSPAPPSSTPSCPESPSVCVTPACVTVAASIYNAMDVTADPCEDFYQYACGGWVDKHPLPSGHSRWGTFNVLWQENQIILKKVIGKIPSFLFNLRIFWKGRRQLLANKLYLKGCWIPHEFFVSTLRNIDFSPSISFKLLKKKIIVVFPTYLVTERVGNCMCAKWWKRNVSYNLTFAYTCIWIWFFFNHVA